jgi:glycosyltransferase involved in cell wall biosynthesis
MAARSSIKADGMSELEPISVIIPTYNRAGGLLEKAIDSVLAQVDVHCEVLVVDDGSTDETKKVLDSYGAEIRNLHQENKGPAAARNLGINEAAYNLLAFLDSDDWWDKKKLSIQARAMAENPDYLISHTDEVWFRKGVFLNQKKIHARPHGHIFDQCLPLCCVGMSTVMVRRDFFNQVGLFDESFPCCEDYELWLRSSISLPFFKIEEPLTYKQGGREDQVSSLFRVGMDRFRIRAMEKVAAQENCTAKQRLTIAHEIVKKTTIYAKGCLKHGRPDEAAVYQSKLGKWQEIARK